MNPPLPSDDDPMKKIERILSPSIKDERMTVSIPKVISIPVDVEETSHIIIFNNGDMSLVQEGPESKSNPNSIYKKNFATTHVGVDVAIYNMSTVNNPIAALKTWGNCTVIDPNLSDENEKLFVESFNKAMVTVSQIKEERVAREGRVKESTLKILRGKNSSPENHT